MSALRALLQFMQRATDRQVATQPAVRPPSHLRRRVPLLLLTLGAPPCLVLSLSTLTHVLRRRSQQQQTLSVGLPHQVVVAGAATEAQLPPGESLRRPSFSPRWLSPMSALAAAAWALTHVNARARRVVVLQEEDPKPGAVLGRFSFK